MKTSAAAIYWDVIPYVALAVLIVGLWWRYRYDKFGWTTRSSELYEKRLLRIGSPLFHYGILVVIVGHVIGLVIPQSWTDAVGISENLYHFGSGFFGLIAAAATIVGLGILIFRRRTQASVFTATTKNDKTMYVFLAGAIVTGTAVTIIGQIDRANEAMNYRETVSPWFRSIWYLHPEGALMAEAPLGFHIHVTIALILFAIWPFTRLVHVFSAPVQYLFRPYVVYRTRGKAPKDELLGSAPRRRGW
ncbi:respiratory nitrate reductase subunit gamma [Rhodococcus sp. D2-41]|uniref:Nitrate reductase-like protein NarX n=1 Tax=Speluncibacter jeojiensis TaxID=2710754 RepID=A0A9X4REH4_9ACTN|nr:respiratory nitrate reductase subunit gamma [Rhodococcus sp. D2-41]MDG3009066.1 respiratory nitrate reductase subunit gamma [Rhodococcus sp. D2-41]MDG3015578.1 respiratory nitrate reductase subunit gamma [Corynebacteriales bacterium D3-21]